MSARVDTPLRRLASQFAESRVAVGGLLTIVLIVLLALLAPWVSPQNPYDLAALDIMDSRLPPGSKSMGGMVYLLGTDDQGRDLLSAIFYGLRTSIFVAVLATLTAVAVGASVGLVSGYLGGWFDEILMRVVDIQLSFPSILIALVLLAVLGQGVDKIVIALVAVQWAYYARTVRGTTLVERNKEYVQAADRKSTRLNSSHT